MTRAYQRGINAEAAVCTALAREGWTVLAQRLRTEAGEIDVVAATPDLLAIVEVKARPTLADAAMALGARQRRDCWRRPTSCWRSIRSGRGQGCGSI
jgi:putative endonuclease